KKGTANRVTLHYHHRIPIFYYTQRSVRVYTRTLEDGGFKKVFSFFFSLFFSKTTPNPIDPPFGSIPRGTVILQRNYRRHIQTPSSMQLPMYFPRSLVRGRS